eukprot:4215820-Pleurochrysis_carterae.AAC.1
MVIDERQAKAAESPRRIVVLDGYVSAYLRFQFCPDPELRDSPVAAVYSIAVGGTSAGRQAGYRHGSAAYNV